MDMPYTRVDMEKIKKEFTEIMVAFDKAETGEEQFAVHQQFYRMNNMVRTQMTIAQIRHDIDTKDTYYKEEQDYYDANIPILQNLNVAYQTKLYHTRFRAYMEEKIGKVAFKNMELAMKSVDEKILPLMQEENVLVTKYNNLLASAQIEWNGDTLNLSLLNPYMKDKDREIRAKAWEKYTAFFKENQEEFDQIYDKLVHNRTEQARQLGYENYLELGYFRMNRNCYDQEMVAKFRKQVKKYIVPFAEMLHEKRRKRLGIETLSFIDEGVYFLNGNPRPQGSPEEILEKGRKMYHALSTETGKFMDFMCENELFDVIGRKTKRAGGYMTYMPDYKAPFIFANFNGTSGDIDVITHECGHAFQGYVIADDPIMEHADITMETAETHSMSMEFFTEKWMNMFFGERAEDYRDMHLEDAVSFIPYGTMVDEFQHIIYENPDMKPSERNRVWRELEKEYKPHLQYDGNEYLEQGGYWQHQLHIYNYPLYYIDYCIAQTNALQYKAWMEQDFGEAWKSYMLLCKLSATDFFTGLLEKVGLHNPFEEGSLEDMVQVLEDKMGIMKE